MEITERLTRVELALEKFIDHVDQSLDRLSMEMQEFKEEMRTEAQRRQEEMRTEAQRRQEEIQAFKEEMRRNELRRDKEMRTFKQEMNQKWGDMARKMGTIVEDIIYPGIEPVLAKYFKCEPLHSSIRIKKKRGALRDEFDIIAVAEKYVFLVEVKSAPNHNHVLDLEDKIARFQHLFPEYGSKQLVMILAAMVMPRDVVNLCTGKGYYALAYRQWEYLDILNFEALSPLGKTGDGEGEMATPS